MKWLALALMLVILAWLQVAAAEELRLGILHVNDTHGHLLPYRYGGQDGWGGAARLGAAVQSERADNAYFWLTLHAGDAFQAEPFADGLYRWLDPGWLQHLGLEALRGAPMSNAYGGMLDIACMNRTGFDALGLGNHEFDFGLDTLRQCMAEADFAVLSANVVESDHGAVIADPWVVLQRGPYRIGIIGLTTESLPLELPYDISCQVEVLPAIPAAAQLAAQLRAEGCDIVIALTHLGVLHDIELARAVPELDVIVGGHSHTFLAQPILEAATTEHNTVVTQAGCYGVNLGVLKLLFTREAPGQRFRLADYSEQFVPLAPSLPQDPEITAYLEQHGNAPPSAYAGAPASMTAK